MEPRYDIKEVESRIYKKWEDSGLFNPDVCVEKGVTRADAEPFSIVLPPPNVTGTLHIGHAFEDTLQDIAVRYARMQGKRTLWIPGTDHAAIATQSKVEKEILKTEKKSRHDLGREEFLRRVHAFAKESHDTIVRQVKRLGSSLDWSREAYTLDEKRGVGVRTAFKKMYDLGLIYRGNRVVNWDPKGQTVISDDEVQHEERKAKLYTFRYNKNFPISIATTRLETKFGDTAVAVHPSDERYKKFVGKEFDANFCGVPIHIKVIADESVEKDFGTGALGVTPAHSMVDWEIAERHKLPLVQVINEYGKMTVPGFVNGKKTEEARELVAEELRKNGLIEKEEEITQNVSIAERTGAVIEPLPKLQWFVAVNKPFKRGLLRKTTLKKLMHEAAASGDVKITPERFEKIYFHWIENLRDWCISRQIWFGHRIPVWYCMACGEPHVNANIKSKWFLVRHGETDWNKTHRSQGQSDIPLNEAGREQVKGTAEILKSENIDLIISSDLLRAKETAEIISKATGAEILIDERFRERHFGLGEGMDIDERNRLHGDLFKEYDKTYEGGETVREVEKRAVEALLHHKKGHDAKNVVITTHGVTILALRKYIKKLDHVEMFNHTSPNASILPIEIGGPCKKCGTDFYEQDPDTLDTWFSSALWPFSTLGWPEKTADLATYFPNSLMAPGYEILQLWVARMILMSGVLLDSIPFTQVLIHGIVRDAKGQKFSKSLGNGIDPLVLADTYGADALRMSLIVGAAPGNDVKFDEQRVKGYRNFSTKIWNIARFIEMNKPSGTIEKIDISGRAEIKELAELKKEVTAHIEMFEFHLAGEKLYHYIWHTLADKIVEAEKKNLRDGTPAEKTESYALLETLLLGSLKMLHPFMPFVTEEVYGIFRPGTMLMVDKW